MRLFAMLLCFVLLAGCGVVVGVEGGSLLATDKTFTDHIVSFASGKDCSVIRKERGLAYCVEDQLNPRARVHCYRTLGRVTCYERPDPYGARQEEVGRMDHNLPTTP